MPSCTLRRHSLLRWLLLPTVALRGSTDSAAPRHDLHRDIRCVLASSRSNEDITLLPLLRALAGGRPGTFVEMGAYDGTWGSQTWLLEKCFGWSGVLIEASPQNFAKLLRTNRSKAVKVHSAVCETPGQIAFNGGGGTVAGVSDDFPTRFANRWNKTHREDCGNLSCVSNVPCKPLPTLLTEAGYPRVNFLALDVEGGEERVLQTVPMKLSNFPFDMVMVEADKHNRLKNYRVRRMMLKMGMVQHYLPASTGSINQLYVRPGIRDPRPLGEEYNALCNEALSPQNKSVMAKLVAGWPMSAYLNEMHGSATNRPLIWQRLAVGMQREVAALMRSSTEYAAQPPSVRRGRDRRCATPTHPSQTTKYALSDTSADHRGSRVTPPRSLVS